MCMSRSATRRHAEANSRSLITCLSSYNGASNLAVSDRPVLDIYLPETLVSENGPKSSGRDYVGSSDGYLQIMLSPPRADGYKHTSTIITIGPTVTAAGFFA